MLNASVNVSKVIGAAVGITVLVLEYVGVGFADPGVEFESVTLILGALLGPHAIDAFSSVVGDKQDG